MCSQDETFPELGVGSVEGCDDQESVCSSNEREGDAFPKAFDRDLVTPTNLQKSHATDSIENAVTTSSTTSVTTTPATVTPATNTPATETSTITTSKSSDNETKEEVKSADNNDGTYS